MLDTANPSDLLLLQIMAGLQRRYEPLNRHYEVWWSDKGCQYSCQHAHSTLRQAAQCGVPKTAGWCVVAVEYKTPRQLTKAEEQIVNDFRFEVALVNASRAIKAELAAKKQCSASLQQTSNTVN
jgi:monoamine oxidase